MGHADSVGTVDVRARRNSVFGVWAENPRAFVIAVVFGILIGGAVVFLLRTLADTGDEAPIRVKSGSMYFDIISSRPGKWQQDNNEWKIDTGTRGNDDLHFIIDTTVSDTCVPDASAFPTNKLFVEYDDGFTVQISSTGKHLRVKPDDMTKLTSDGNRRLTFGTSGTGFIKFIYKQNKSGTPLCTFTADKKLLSLTVDDH